jgi:hypothetical protein
MILSLKLDDFRDDFKRQPLLILLMFAMLTGFPAFVFFMSQKTIHEIAEISTWEHRRTQIMSKLFSKKTWLEGENAHMQNYLDAGVASPFQKRRLSEGKNELRRTEDLIVIVSQAKYPMPIDYIEQIIPRGNN